MRGTSVRPLSISNGFVGRNGFDRSGCWLLLLMVKNSPTPQITRVRVSSVVVRGCCYCCCGLFGGLGFDLIWFWCQGSEIQIGQ